jgi:hypothetical protein
MRSGKDRTPLFFETLMKDGNDTAFDELLKGSILMGVRPQAVYLLKSQAKSSLSVYGKMVGFDFVKE